MIEKLTLMRGETASIYKRLFGVTLFRHWDDRKIVEVAFVETDFPAAELEFSRVRCPYTRIVFDMRDGIVLGPVVPQAPHSLWCHPLAVDVRARSKRLFDAEERNCNTCIYLERVAFDKKSQSGSGLQPGICRHPNPEPLYPRGGNRILFAPEDHMGQSCYLQRN